MNIYHKSCSILSWLVAVVLILAAGAHPRLQAQTVPDVEPAVTAADLYQPADHGFTVLEEPDLALKDAPRQKKLPVRVTFPDGEGPFPVIVFSHGALGSKDNYQPLVRYWVSHGYVCLQPTHEDSRKLMAASERRNPNNIWSKWSSRVQDVVFLLDSLDQVEAAVGKLGGKLDRNRIGMGGHSFGAHTSQIIGGAQQRHPMGGKMIRMADDRPRAILLISPQGTGDGKRGLVRESWQAMTRPSMVVTGSNDRSVRSWQGGPWRREVFDFSLPGDKYLVWIDGAYHGFGGIAGSVRYPTSGPDNPTHVAIVQAYSLAFWDAYLKGDDDAKAWLADQAIDASAEAVTLEAK